MKKRFIIIMPIIIAAVAFVFVYRFYNKEDSTTTLTVNEKKWVEENKEKTYDFAVVNDYPLYGENGSGVIFNFIDDFEENIGIEFNKISFLKDANPENQGYKIRILDNETNLSDKDLLIFEDNYIIVGKEYKRINHIKDMKNISFGVFKEDAEEISNEFLKTIKSDILCASKDYKVGDMFLSQIFPRFVIVSLDKFQKMIIEKGENIVSIDLLRSIVEKNCHIKTDSLQMVVSSDKRNDFTDSEPYPIAFCDNYKEKSKEGPQIASPYS